MKRTTGLPVRSARFACGGLLLSALSAMPCFAGGIALVRTIVEDNGDGDGYADTRESITLRLEVQNTSGAPQAGVVAHLATPDYQKICLTLPVLPIGNLAPGETRVTDGGFQFVVADIDRSQLGLGELGSLSARFDLSFTAQLATPAAVPDHFDLDLDLDVTGGSTPTAYFESFEGSDLGTFAIDNIDGGKHSEAATDGYRCQYNDPDWPNSNSYDSSMPCLLGNSPMAADATFWQLSGPGFSPLGGRGFSGVHSLFFGIDVGPPNNWTTPMGTLEAARSIDPIHLGWDAVSPVLSLKQQVSLFDYRSSDGGIMADGESLDRGVVLAQLADAGGAPAGPWIKLYPFQNAYDEVHSPIFENCAFDPIDDGTTEDDFFDPQDPARKFGPSSTCWPEPVFGFLGETELPWDASHLGRADGPGLQGVWGIGTWIESRFDLSRFRGRNVRLRFLFSSIFAGGESADDWMEYLQTGDDPGDDGWWIDDVTINGALAVAASVSPDDKPYGGLPGIQPEFDPDSDQVCNLADNCPLAANPDQVDADADTFGAGCDCNDLLATVHSGAVEINDGIDNNCPGDAGYALVDEISGLAGFFKPGDKAELSWPAQSGATRYQVARATVADFTAGCTKLPLAAQAFKSDPAVPPVGSAYYYLVRAFLPHAGSWGADSNGQERVVPCQ